MKLLSVLLLLAGLAHANSITVVLDNPTQTGPDGSTLEFTGTLLNTTGGTLYINGDTLTAGSPLIGDDSAFLANAPLSIDSLVTSSGFVFFDITVPAGASAGQFFGQFIVEGGPGPSDQLNLGSAAFSVNIPVPEPLLTPAVSIFILLALLVGGRLRSKVESA